MKTLTEKRDALLRRRAELLEEWARNKAALLKRPEERPESAAGENMPPKRMRITGILGELDAELDRLERLIAEEARKDREEGPGKKAEERARSTAEEPAEEPAKEPAEEPTEAPAEEPEAPPVLPPALQSQVDSVLQRLEDCYPDHTVRGIVQRHRQLSEDLTTVCKQLGYATREDFLTAYGYRIGSWRRNQVPPVRRWTEPAAPPKGETDGVPRPRREPSPEPEIPRKIEGEPGGSLDGQIAPESPEDLPVQYLREIGVLADSPGPRTGSADRLKQKTDSVLRRLEQYYPDHVIPGRLEQDHKSLSSDISEVYRLLGYESRKEFLNAYGYTYETSVGGRPSQDFQPMLDALIEKYRDRERPSAMGALLFENPEYKKSLKTLQNKAQELFGMSLVKYFQSIGIIAEKGTPRARAASSAGREETAAGLSPAATARLKDLYQGLNPRFYGTFEDAVRKLEGLEAGCTRGVHARFCITGVTDCPPDVEIPQGFHFIQEGAFQNQEKLETVVLPDSLTEIQSSAFENCTGLRRVTLPEGLKRIGNRAFAGCTALEEVDFQGGVPQVSESAFEGSAYQYTPPEAQGDSDGRDFTYTAASGGLTITGYTGRAEKLAIPRRIQGVSVRMIAKGAFSGNRYLSEVTMPDTIQRVQGLAFEGCISLRKIHLSNAMTKLINTTFNGCIGLREVNIPDGVTVLREKTFKDTALERVHIGKGLEALDPGCFFRTYELEDGRNNHPRPLSEITVDPENPHLRAEAPFVLSADGKALYAFLGAGLCEIPEGVERIGPNAFAGRTGLTDVTFPSTLTEIGEHAFSYNPSLRRIEFGENLRIIGSRAFLNCEHLSSALFSEGLEEIGDYAFRSCPIHLAALPSSLRRLGEDCFDCLSRYYNARENPQELRIGPGGPIEADGDAVYQVDGESKTLVRTYGPRFSAYYYDYEDEDYDGEAEAVLTRYTVTEGTTAIARGAFEGCNRLLSVQLPDSLREIGPRAFYGCTRLGNIRLPQGLRSIGEEAFRGTAIQELTLPPELESVGVMAFAAREYYDEVTALKNIQVSAGNPRFQAADGFLLRQKEDGTRALMCAFGADETMEVPEGVSEIEPLAFYRSAVKEVWLPASVTDVAMDAFRQCRNLVRLRLEFPQPENGLRRAVFYFPEFREEESYYDAYHAREQYLDCIRTNRDGVFDIVKYDSLFPSIQEFKDRILIATDRLKSAVQLVPLYRDEYLNWLRENAAEAVRTVIEFDDLAGLNTLAELGVFTGKNIDELIELANASRKPEILSYLMNYKNAEIGITETDYEL